MVTNLTLRAGLALPATADEIDVEWLRAALAPNVPRRARLVSARPESGSASVGLMGEITRFHLDWDGDGDTYPPTIILKTPSALDENRALAVMMSMYDTEHHFYQELAPTIGLRTPRCWYSGSDDDSGRFALLLDDIGGYDRADQAAGLDPVRAAQTIEAIARMHARWWGSPALTQLPWLTQSYGEPLKFFGDILRGSLPAYTKALADVLTDADLTLVEHFVGNYEAMVDRDNGDDLVPTLVHRDFRVDNMVFDADGPIVFDWATVAAGPALYDLAYFLGGSLTVEDRRAHHDDLLGLYHQTLVGAGVADYPWARFVDQLHRITPYTLIVAIMAGGTALDARDVLGVQLIRITSRRMCDFYHDLGSMA